MPITTLPTPPQRTDDADLYVSKADAFVASLPQFVIEANALAANLNSVAVGGAYAIPYTVDLSTTADSDPGNGKIRFDNVTQNLATTLRLDLLGSNLVDYTAILDTFDYGSSLVKGSIRLAKLSDPSKFLLFSVTARTAPSGYRDISVTPAGSSSANPFANGDAVFLFYQKTGDKGDIGTPVQVFHVQETQASGSAASSGTGVTTNGATASISLRRALNTVVANQITGASLSGNQITLPPGTYKGRAMCPAINLTLSSAGGTCAARLVFYNVTDSVIAAVGQSANAVSATGSTTVGNAPPATVAFAFTLTSAKVFDMRHLFGSGSASVNLGSPAGLGTNEVYLDIVIEKIG